MTRIIENNGPAQLLVGISDAIEMAEAGDVPAALAELRILRDTAQRVVNWVRDLQEAGLETPEGLGWTERLHEENRKKTSKKQHPPDTWESVGEIPDEDLMMDHEFITGKP